MMKNTRIAGNDRKMSVYAAATKRMGRHALPGSKRKQCNDQRPDQHQDFGPQENLNIDPESLEQRAPSRASNSTSSK